MTNVYRYYPPRLDREITDLTRVDERIAALWKAKRDTYAIALQLGIPEHQVANRLAQLRDAERGA
jgi:DNA-binding CsgD family transcriptional regulator